MSLEEKLKGLLHEFRINCRTKYPQSWSIINIEFTLFLEKKALALVEEAKNELDEEVISNFNYSETFAKRHILEKLDKTLGKFEKVKK